MLAAAFHTSVTLALPWDGIYLDEFDATYPARWYSTLEAQSAAFDIDGDGVADSAGELAAQYAAWRPYFAAALRGAVGDARLLVANNGGDGGGSSHLNGITIEAEDCCDGNHGVACPPDAIARGWRMCANAFAGQAAISAHSPSLSVLWHTHDYVIPAAAQCAGVRALQAEMPYLVEVRRGAPPPPNFPPLRRLRASPADASPQHSPAARQRVTTSRTAHGTRPTSVGALRRTGCVSARPRVRRGATPARGVQQSHRASKLGGARERTRTPQCLVSRRARGAARGGGGAPCLATGRTRARPLPTSSTPSQALAACSQRTWLRTAGGGLQPGRFGLERSSTLASIGVWKVASLYRTRGRSGASPVTVGGAPAVVFWQRSHSTERIAGTTGVMGGGRWGPETVAFVLQAMMVRRRMRH